MKRFFEMIITPVIFLMSAINVVNQEIMLPTKSLVEKAIQPWTSSQCQCCTKMVNIHLS
jgi:hypothetical protein